MVENAERKSKQKKDDLDDPGHAKGAKARKFKERGRGRKAKVNIGSGLIDGSDQMDEELTDQESSDAGESEEEIDGHAEGSDSDLVAADG